MKLEHALDAFGIDPTGMAALDAGASTGGFTDVLLARGARVVYAVDVGRAQLIQRLRDDPRVVSMERTNLRELRSLPEPIDLATLDLSFISLGLVLPAVRSLAGRCRANRRAREAPVRGGAGRRPARRGRHRPGDLGAGAARGRCVGRDRGASALTARSARRSPAATAMSSSSSTSGARRATRWVRDASYGDSVVAAVSEDRADRAYPCVYTRGRDGRSAYHGAYYDHADETQQGRGAGR